MKGIYLYRWKCHSDDSAMACMIDSSPESEIYALKSSQDEIYVVPCLYWLGAPCGIKKARGSVFGLTGESRKTLSKAALQSIATKYAIIDSWSRCQNSIPVLRVGGGAAKNDYFSFRQIFLELRLPCEKLRNNCLRSNLPSRSDRRLLRTWKIKNLHGAAQIFEPKI